MSVLDGILSRLLDLVESGNLGAAAHELAALEELVAKSEVEVTVQTQEATKRVGLALHLALDSTKTRLAAIHQSRQTLKAYAVPGGRGPRAGRLA